MTTDDARRAAKGAELLDSVDPDWIYKINPATLDLNDYCNCIGAQVFRRETDTSEWLGFDRLVSGNAFPLPEDFECYVYGFGGDLGMQLRDAWVAEVKTRLSM